jgi:hypothetical protein
MELTELGVTKARTSFGTGAYCCLPMLCLFY